MSNYDFYTERFPLGNMPQYQIPRDRFTEIFYEVFGKDFDWYDLIDFQGDSFKCWWNNDTFYILDGDSGILVTWYKHIGRCHECNHIMDESDYRLFFEELRKEVE